MTTLLEPIVFSRSSKVFAQLVALSEENGARIASTIWSINDARDVESFLADASEFSSEFRSLVSYAAPETPVEGACPLSGSIGLRGLVTDDSVGVLLGEAASAEFRDCAERDFLDITVTRTGRAFLEIVATDGESFAFDLRNDYTAVVESAILSEPIRGTFSGTTRYDVEIDDQQGVTLTGSSDFVSVFGSTPGGMENLEIRDFESSLRFAGEDGVLNYAKTIKRRFEGSSLGGA